MLAYGFAKFFQRIKKYTAGETIGLLFGHKARIAAVVTLLLLYPISISTASLALATTFGPIFNLSYVAAVWVSAAFLVVLAILGLRGQTWMNVIHFATIIVFFVPLTIASVVSVGGLGKIFSSLPSGHLNFMADGFGIIAARMTSAILIKLIALSAITAMFAAKSESDAKKGAIGTGIFLAVFVSMPALIGLAAYTVGPDIESKQALWFMSERLGDWATTMTSVAVLAAIISTTPAMLLGLSTVATRDVFLLLKPDADDRQQILFSRLAIVFLGFAGTAMVLAMSTNTTILDLTFKSVGVRSVITVPMFISILWRRVHPTAAFLAILFGGISGAAWTFSGSPFGVDPMWPALGTSCLTLAVVSLFRRPFRVKGAEGLDLTPGKFTVSH